MQMASDTTEIIKGLIMLSKLQEIKNSFSFPTQAEVLSSALLPFFDYLSDRKACY